VIPVLRQFEPNLVIVSAGFEGISVTVKRR
jgi:acetoin utilization deacetylase AcuC-like enzyme